MKTFKSITMAMFFSSVLVGCGAEDELGPKVAVKVQSAPFAAALNLTAVEEMKFCITQVKLTTSGEAAGESEARLGLVDVSNSAVTNTWGELEIEEGAEITSVSMEVHKDAETCGGAEYSLLYNGVELQKDLEFKFKFDTPIKISDGSVLTLAFDKTASAFIDAEAAGMLDDENVGKYMEALEEAASQESEGSEDSEDE